MLNALLLPLTLVASEAQPAAAPQVPTTYEDAAGPPAVPFPPPPPSGVYRGVSLSFAAGPGWLALRDDLGRDGQRAMGFAGRLGMLLHPDWMAHLGGEHTFTRRSASTFSQSAVLLGVQRFFFQRAYLSGAVGASWVRMSSARDGLMDGPGFAWSAALGAEVFQTDHASVTAEVAFTMGHYEVERWEMGGVRLGLSIF